MGREIHEAGEGPDEEEEDDEDEEYVLRRAAGIARESVLARVLSRARAPQVRLPR